MRINALRLFACLIFSADSLVPSYSIAQSTTVTTSLCGCQPTAGSPCPGNTNYLLYTFALNVTSGTISFTAINNFSTSGTYLAGDIVNFNLYQTSFSVFNTSTLIKTITTGLVPGAHTFNAFTIPVTLFAAVQRYYWITADFAGAAASGRTRQVNVITAPMYGTNSIAGFQTICSTLPVDLISFEGKSENGKNALEWKVASETDNDFFTLERSD